MFAFNKIRLARSYTTAKDFGAQEIQVWKNETDSLKNDMEMTRLAAPPPHDTLRCRKWLSPSTSF